MSIKRNTKNFMWGSIVIIILIFVFYSIYTGKGIKTFEIPGKLKIEFEGKNDKPSSTFNGESYNISMGTTDYYINPPGKSRIALSSIETVLLTSGSDDPVNRHQELILNALESGNMNRTFEEKDIEGNFSLWLTYRISSYCVNYTTLLQRHDGSKELAFRKACKTDNTWTSEIAPEIREMYNSVK